MNVTSHKDLKAMKRYGNIIDAIIEQGNMSASFDDVLGDLKNESRKAFLRERKQLIIDRLAAAIRDGSFRITHVHEMVVTDGQNAGSYKHRQSSSASVAMPSCASLTSFATSQSFQPRRRASRGEVCTTCTRLLATTFVSTQARPPLLQVRHQEVLREH